MTDLVAIAVDNLKDTCDSICKMAAEASHFNQHSKEMKDALKEFENRLALVFTLKNAMHEVSILPKQPA